MLETKRNPYGDTPAGKLWLAMGADAMASRFVNALYRETGARIDGKDGQTMPELLRKHREAMPDWRNVGVNCLDRVDEVLRGLPELPAPIGSYGGPAWDAAFLAMTADAEESRRLLDEAITEAVNARLTEEADGLRREADDVTDGKSAHTLMWAAARIDPTTEV